MSLAAWITTSWDDGNPLDLRVAEMLQRNGLKATFYIPRAIETGVMSEPQIRQLSESFEIGGHTLDHLFLPTIPDAQAKVQIAGCKKWVEDTTGQPCRMFCPPAGKFTEAHRGMIAGAQFIGLRSVEFLSTSAPRRVNGLLEMPTTLQSYPHRRKAYVKNAVKRQSWSGLARYILHGAPTNWETHAEQLLGTVVRHGGVFHLWGHSWEIERTNQWEPLERVLRVMGQFAKHARAATNREVCEAFGG